MNEFSSAPNKSQFPYAGWVPTANGRLSFRHIGETAHPTQSVYANVATSTVRLLLAYQARPFSDVLFSPIQELFGITGRFWFAITAESNSVPSNSDTLRGRIFLFKSKADWRARGQPNIRPSIKEINKSLRFLEPAGRDAALQTKWTEAYNGLSQDSDIYTDFELSRTGEVYFSIPAFKDVDLRDGSSELAESIGHSFNKSVADQAYFFLRDICHAHQHHDANEDTILILQNRDDETQWRKFILYSLQYQAIRAKRAGYPQTIRALGILAYCASFRMICEMRQSWGEIGNLPTFNEGPVRESITAQNDYISAKLSRIDAHRAERLGEAANIRTYALAALAIAIAGFGVLIQPQINNAKFEKLNVASAYASSHPAAILLSICALFLLIWFATSDLFDWRFFKWDVGKDILEASNVRRRSSRKVLLLIGACSVAAGIYFGWAAVANLMGPLAHIWNLLG